MIRKAHILKGARNMSQPTSRLEPQSACWPNSEAHPQTGEYGITITAVSRFGIINFRCTYAESAPITKCFGTSLPAQPNQANVAGERMAIWLGPDETLLLLADQDESEFSRAANALMAGRLFALNTVSDAFAIYDIEGNSAREMLAKGISVDLHKDYFTPLQTAQTNLSHASVTLICMAENTFRVICRASFADYVESWLKDASTEYGYQLKQG